METGVMELYCAIHKKKKRLAVEAAESYILPNRAEIMEQEDNKELECSAEGHVSHIYADRMSSRPLGWGRTGADKMARLRVYRANGGDMLELVRCQEAGKAAGAEEEVTYSSSDMFLMEKRNRERLGGLAALPAYSIPYTKIKKIAALKSHIWGL